MLIIKQMVKARFNSTEQVHHLSKAQMMLSPMALKALEEIEKSNIMKQIGHLCGSFYFACKEISRSRTRSMGFLGLGHSTSSIERSNPPSIMLICMAQ